VGHPTKGLAGDKISETPTVVLREMVNEIKNSDDIKYKKDKLNSVKSNNVVKNLLRKRK